MAKESSRASATRIRLRSRRKDIAPDIRCWEGEQHVCSAGRSGDQDSPLGHSIIERVLLTGTRFVKGIMASGHVNRTNRPNTWLLRPMLQSEDFPCQPGAIHKWPVASFRMRAKIRSVSGQS
jgi:hypothetical protein